jgi:hypothetical protein
MAMDRRRKRRRRWPKEPATAAQLSENLRPRRRQ